MKKNSSRDEILTEMRPARSRRVQAQRKFAQGAYVPPTLVHTVAAESRRDTAQDTRNVTINNVTASNLLDVVALQSAASSPDRSDAASSPERNETHRHRNSPFNLVKFNLTSEPVVMLENLRSRNRSRDVLPPPRRPIERRRPWINSTFAQDYLNEQSVNNNVDTIKKPVDPPKLRVGKKRKEYKKEHPMSLRSRRPSKLQSNKLIAESCTPVRKVALKRKKNSSDEDEPLIFQINRLKQKASRETASREDILKPSSSKENHLKPSSSRENTLKPYSAEEESLKNKPCQKRFKKDVTTNNIITSEVTTQKTITKGEITTKSTTKKISIKKACQKKTARRGVKQIIAKKTQKKKNKKKRKHKKCSPKQHARVAPECSVPEFPVTVRTEDVTDETVTKNLNKDLGTLGSEPTPKNRVPEHPVDKQSAHDAPIVNDDISVGLQDMSSDDFTEPLAYGDWCIMPCEPEGSQNERANEVCRHDESCLSSIVESENISVDKITPNDTLDWQVVMDSPNALQRIASPGSEPTPKNRVPEHPVDKQSAHDAPIVNDDISVGLQDMSCDDFTEPLVYGDWCIMPCGEPSSCLSSIVESENISVDKITPNDTLDRKDVMDSPNALQRIASPEPGPSGMAMRFKLYNSDSGGYDMVYSDHPMYLGDPEENLSKPLMDFAEWSSDDERFPIKVNKNVEGLLEITQNEQTRPPTAGVTAERSSDVGEPVDMDILANRATNLELTENVQLETPVPCAAASCRSDKDVINASKEFLLSRCKVCRPCIRIDKLMKVSALLESQMGLSSKGRQNKTAENETPEKDGDTEDVEMDYGDISSPDVPGTLYLLLPNQSSMMIKLRSYKEHGKEVLGVGLMPKNESLINKEFLLEKHECLLDQIIENLTEHLDINFEGGDVNLVTRDVNLVGTEVGSQAQNDNTEIPRDNIEHQFDGVEPRQVVINDNTEGETKIVDPRRISISSDSTVEISDSMTDDQKTPARVTAPKKRIKRIDVKKKLAEMHERMREEKEREIARLEEEKREEIKRILAEKNNAVAQMSRYHERVAQMERDKKRDMALLKVKVQEEVISKIEAKRQMYNEVDGMAANLAKEKDAKSMIPELLQQDEPGTSSSEFLPKEGGLLVDAPIYYPTEEEFRDPLLFYLKILPEAVKFGICKVVPPPDWQPPSRVTDEMRFDVMNQYISRLFNRWGPAARELCAIKLSLAQQNVNFTRPPLLDGVEVNLPKLYHLVKRHGGLEAVCNRKRWAKVAEDMKFSKGTNTERKLDQIYVKYILPYDTLSHQERQDIMRKVEIAWNRKHQKLLDRALNPLNRQQRLLGLIDDEDDDDETEDDETAAALNEAEDCIIKGVLMNRAKFRKLAYMMYESVFGQGSDGAEPPDLDKIEEYYWRLVTMGTEHVCVHSAAVDTGEEGYGFTKNKSDPYGRHPWNPKMISQNKLNVLQYLGQVMGVTMPTLLLGMLFSTSCWHKDPHTVGWLEYQMTGPERIWYGIPADQADNFRKAVETLCPTSCQNKFHWLSSDITMIPPNLLREHNVTLSRVTQRDGEYILAFPNAYTCCISTGYTESESVYFAPPAWLENVWKVFKDARESCEPTMFAMEHLLYNIGKDPKCDHTILKIAQPIFDKMLREEVTNRQMLQERGLPFVQELLSANSSRKKNAPSTSNPRDQEECEYCRASLYLSKVKGLTGRYTVLCLEHALKLLDTEKYKDTDVSQLQVLVHVSVKELNNVHDDMKRRLNIPTA